MKTRKLGILAGVVVALATWTSHAQEDPAKAQVGDWTSMKMAGPAFEMTLKQTLTAKDDTTATIKMEQKFGGKDLPPQEQKVPLSQLADPTKLAGKADQTKVEKLKSGKETLTVKGKKMECEWTEYKTTVDAGGKSFTSSVKVWVSREIPLYGLAKLETEAMGQKMTMETVDYGRGK